MTQRARTFWTFAITSTALFMVVLDNLVVSTALPVIRTDLGATIEELEWTVNAYTLTFAVFLLTGAALGDRFGRKRMFAVGVAVFTAASAAAALAPSMDWLIAARAVQGVGAALVTPLTLTILSAAVPRDRRGLALGAWSGIAGLAVAAGPLVGGAVVDGISWQWIFWLNVPVGLVLLPLATRLQETHGPDSALDLPGLALASVGLLGIVWGLVHGNGEGWTSPEIVGSLVAGAVLLAAFVAWELADAGADAADAALPQPGVQRRERGVALHVLRDVRVDLPADPVLPDRAGLLAARGGPARPAVDGDADGRRTDRGRALRPDRRQAVHGARARAAGGRARVDRGGLGCDRRVRLARRPVRPLRHRHGDVLRPGRERRPLGRPAAGGGQGVRREQRDPRGRGRVRRRRAGLDLHALRRVHVARDVHRRARRRHLGRRWSSEPARSSRSSSRAGGEPARSPSSRPRACPNSRLRSRASARGRSEVFAPPALVRSPRADRGTRPATGRPTR